MNVSYEISILISGIICGMILFQTIVVAPSVFKTMNESSAGPFLRSVFPRLFLLILALGILSVFLTNVFGSPSYANIMTSGVTVLCMSICYLIVPATNRSKDEGNKILFGRLHALSVILTMSVLIANLIWIYF
ncbi:MAG: DUF4149 domain-containing protein [Pseudomonadota bacterium]|nr:DUF4149 domain-containing protein [Pseudomonadota bacterium]